MVASCFSIISLCESFLRRSLTAAGLSSQTIDIDNETTIHFWGPKPNSSSNSKPCLVLLHGFGPPGVWQFSKQVVFFARDFNIYMPDLVFFGDSTTKSQERSEFFQAIWVGKLLEKIGVKRYSVLGTSYGGFVAYNMASMWPERVERLVIASSATNMTKKDNEEFLKRANVENIDDLMLPTTARQLRTANKFVASRRPYMPNFLLDDVIDKLISKNREEKKELLHGLTLASNDTVKVTPLQQEVLIVFGEQDQIFPLQKAYELKEILGKKARLEVIKNASHVPQIEKAWQFNSIVKNFLCGS